MKTITIRGVTIGKGSPKICVPIVGICNEEILKAADAITESKADIVEWRADWYDEVMESEKTLCLLKELRQHLKTIPLLVTFRTKAEGGEKEISAEQYEMFCELILESGYADLLDIELSMEEERIKRLVKKAHEKQVYTIISSHDFQKTPEKEEIIKRLRSMQEMNGDIAKMAVMPKSAKDVLTLMEATLEMKEKWSDRPLITMSMGGNGSISRMAGEFFGSDVTFGAMGKASAPGQIPVLELKESLKVIHRSIKGQNNKKNLYLIGFMGCGKSTVAYRLEQRYGLVRLEMDQEIEHQQGMTISDIFERYGEGHFRKIESHFLEELQDAKDLVVSCGGGVVLKPENVACMKENGVIVCLTAEPETILERVKNDDKRPLLKGKKNIEDIRKLMDARREKYEAAADFCIATDGKTAEQIADEIMNKIK